MVYRAHDTLLERDVAIEVLSGQALGSQRSARLLHEAGATANRHSLSSHVEAGGVRRQKRTWKISVAEALLVRFWGVSNQFLTLYVVNS